MVNDVLIRIRLLHPIVRVQLTLRIDLTTLWIGLTLLRKLLLVRRSKESLAIKVAVVLIAGCVRIGVVRQGRSPLLVFLVFLIFLEPLQKIPNFLQIALSLGNSRKHNKHTCD